MQIIYISDNYMGGVNSLNKNLIDNKPKDGVSQWVIQTDCREAKYSRAGSAYNADKILKFNYSRNDNYYATIRRLRDLIPDEPGALVLNDFLEMMMLDHYPVKQTVYQLIHDQYYVGLFERYHHVVDVFITHNRHLYDNLCGILPDRKKDIFYLPHGVTIPSFFRNPDVAVRDKPLRLLFLARMTESKGIYDLVTISDMLLEMGCSFEWTCIGRGPELPALKERWNKKVPVTFLSPDTNQEVLEIAARHDVFVLPTKFEGTPVSLLETMSVGLVPVITCLAGGIEEIVQSDIGFAPPVDDNMGFARAIKRLHDDQGLLNQLSRNCRTKAVMDFDVKKTALAYHAKFLAYKDFFSVKSLKKERLGSRLDHPLVPSFVTRTIRSILKKRTGFYE